MSHKHLLRAAGVTLLACSTLLTVSGPASASVPGTLVVADSTCQAIELTKIIDGHDHMFVDPTVDNSQWCNFEIQNHDTGQDMFDTATPNGDQPAPNGVYDGPGVHLWVLVTDDWDDSQGQGPVN
jgi:hypothetical protein